MCVFPLSCTLMTRWLVRTATSSTRCTNPAFWREFSCNSIYKSHNHVVQALSFKLERNEIEYTAVTSPDFLYLVRRNQTHQMQGGYTLSLNKKKSWDIKLQSNSGTWQNGASLIWRPQPFAEEQNDFSVSARCKPEAIVIRSEVRWLQGVREGEDISVTQISNAVLVKVKAGLQ